jgi:hypothetical protein
MGCAVSSEQVSDENGIIGDNKGGLTAASQGFTQTINEKSPRIRLDHSEKLKELHINGDGYNFKISYCHISQRGYYPNAMGKANQDSYVICESLLGDTNSHFFGIFDGHGEYGDSCSYFAANSIPSQLVRELKKQGGTKALDGPKMESIYSDTLVTQGRYIVGSQCWRFACNYSIRDGGGSGLFPVIRRPNSLS